MNSIAFHPAWRVNLALHAKALAIAGLTILVAACNSTPSENQGADYLTTKLEAKWGQGAKTVSFKKTNGLSLEKDGAKNYEMEFTAVVQAPEARPVEMTGVVTFVRTENGWIAKNLMGETASHKAEQKYLALVDQARSDIIKIKSELNMYQLDAGNYPTQAQGLQALETAPTTEPIPRLYKPGGYTRLPVDPWGHPYQYRTHDQGNEPDVFSFGTDGKEGGTDQAADIRPIDG